MSDRRRPLFRLLLCAGLWFSTAGAGVAYRIDHLEPASWWAGMRDPRLQLLVHGAQMADLEPSLRYPGAAITGVSRTDNPNYLFIDLALAPEAQPGLMRIEFHRGGERVLTHDYPLQARDAGSAARRGFSPADVIYLITPDRFANGDPGNDRAPHMREGPARSRPDGRHGGDLTGVLAHLNYIAAMGFTQIWMNPLLENDQPEASYHGYAITDFYAIDPRFGDNAQFRALSRAARGKGLGLLMDVVLNHCGSEHWWLKDPPARDWINNGGRFTASNHKLESLHDPHAADDDRKRFSDGWFVPSMPDLNQRNPQLAVYLIQNTLWWIEYAGLAGLRVDTWPYSDTRFLSEWTQRVMSEYPHFNIVAEQWSTNPAVVAYWQRGQRRTEGDAPTLPSLMDFPLQEAAIAGLLEEEGWRTGLSRLYRTLASDFVYPAPGELVVFPENHDMSRLYTQLGEDLALYKMAIAFFATTRGVPQFYYGSEILLTNPGTDAHGVIRGDFPGGWRGDSSNGFTGEGLAPHALEAQRFVRTLLNWRKTASAVHRGKLTHYAPEGGLYVYFRHDNVQKVMVVINKNATAQRLDPARFHEALGDATQATDALTGAAQRLDAPLIAPARGVLVLEIR